MADLHTYKYINYALAPSGLYVGWTFYENGIYYASHRTVDGVIHGVKHQLYLAKKVSYRGYSVAMSATPKEQVPIEKMKQAFLTRAYWGKKTVEKLTPEQIEFNKKIKEREQKAEPAVSVPVIEYDYFDYKIEDGKLTVFGCKKVAEYPIKTPFAQEITKGVLVGDDKPAETPSTTLHLPMEE